MISKVKEEERRCQDDQLDLEVESIVSRFDPLYQRVFRRCKNSKMSGWLTVLPGADLGGTQRVQLHPPSFFCSLLFSLFIVPLTILIYK